MRLSATLEQLEQRCLLAADGLCAEIHGLNWNDLNGDGQYDEGEPGLSGVTVFVDVNRNGILDRGEPTTITLEDDPATRVDEAGHYWMRDVPVGEQLIREIVPAGFRPTFPASGTHRLNIETSGDDEVNFGNTQSNEGAEIHGTKWLDANLDGERSDDEPGLAGVTVYIDFNGNGVPNDNEPSTETDDEGSYRLRNLPPGDHRIREVIPDDFEQTFPATGFHVRSLKLGEIVEGVDFGNAENVRGQIQGTKWIDTNRDGQRDEDETGLAGVVIYVDSNSNGTLDADERATQTHEDGSYSLSDILPGDYTIRELIPTGFDQVFPANGFHQITLPPKQTIEGVDFGNARSQVGSIHGVKWRDANGDGLRDADEGGMAGVVVYADINRNGQWDETEPSARTMADIPETDFDETGQFWLNGLRPGEHAIREIVPDGFRQTSPSTGQWIIDVVAEDSVEGVDFGNQPVRGSIHGLKWRDDSGDGRRDADEPGLVGVIVFSDLNGNGRLDGQEPATRTMADDPETATDETGQYWLDVPPGGHLVREIVLDGFVQTFPTNHAAPPQVDDQPFQLSPESISVTLEHGEEIIAQVSLTVEPLCVRPFEIDVVASDPGQTTNLSGIQTNGCGGDTSTFNVRITGAGAAQGFELQFVDVEFGGVIGVLPVAISTTGEGAHLVQVQAGEIVEAVDFGNQPHTGVVAGSKWHDINGDGQRDPNEPGLSGVTVYVDVNGNGQLDESEITAITLDDDPNTAVDETGFYQLEGLRPGSHVVREIVPEGFQQTFPIEGEQVVEVDPDRPSEDVDFGNQPTPPGSVHGTTWRDDNGNGVREQHEPAYSGVVIYADLNGNGTLDTDEPAAVTMVDSPETPVDESGRYWLAGLTPGRHTIRQVIPEFFEQVHPGNNGYVITVPPGAIINGLDYFNRSLFLPGDSDRDGDVDFDDFVNLSNAFGEVGDWTNGDFDGDELILFDDFVDLVNNFGAENDPAIVDSVFEAG